jgi:hypothetical protein
MERREVVVCERGGGGQGLQHSRQHRELRVHDQRHLVGYFKRLGLETRPLARRVAGDQQSGKCE